MSEDDHCASCEAPIRSDIPWVFFTCGHFSCCKWTDTCICGLGSFLPGVSLHSHEALKHLFAQVETQRNSDPLQCRESVKRLKSYLAALGSQHLPEHSTGARQVDTDSHPATSAAVWTCKSCDYQLNIRELDSCQRCKALRSETQSSNPASAAIQEEEKPGEIDQKLSALSSKKQFWRCEKCNYNTNRAGDTRCQRCKEQKEEERKVQDFTVRRRQSAWVCACGSENKGNNDTCRRCSEYRKTVEGKGNSGQDGGSAGVSGGTGSESSSTDCEKPSPSVDFPPAEGQNVPGAKPKDSSNPVVSRPADRKAPVGQWKCQNCGFAANMATATKCYTCQVGRGAKGKK